MNFLAYSSEKAGVYELVEVLFTDWNSDKPLSEVLQLNSDAAEMVKFIIVPPDTARTHNYKNTPFHTTKSLNTAISRANGKFIAMMPGDILVPEYTLERLFKLLKQDIKTLFNPEESIMSVPRKFIPIEFDDNSTWSSKKAETIEKTLFYLPPFLSDEIIHPGTIGGSGMFIFGKTTAKKLRGFDVAMGGWGYSDHEWAMRISRQYPVINLWGYGLMTFDFQPDYRFLKTKDKRSNLISKFDFKSNDENWGLSQYSFDTAHAKKIETAPSDVNEEERLGEIYRRITDVDYKRKLIHYVDTGCRVYYQADMAPILQMLIDSRPLKYLDICSYTSYRHWITMANPFNSLYFIPPLDSEGRLEFRYFDETIRDKPVNYNSVRCVPVTPEQAINNLRDSFLEDEFSFDLIRYNCNYFKDLSNDFFKNSVFGILADMGVMVFYGDTDYYRSFCEKIESEFAEYSIFKCDRLNTGIFVKIKDAEINANNKKTQEQLYNAWTSPFRRKASWFIIVHGMVDFLYHSSQFLRRYSYRLSHTRLSSFMPYIYKKTKEVLKFRQES